MEKDRLYKILAFNSDNNKEIQRSCAFFYDMLGRTQPFVIPDIQAVARTLFLEKGFKLLHIPMNSDEIGAYQLRLSGNNYLVINTNNSLATNNFAIAHEIYHLLVQPKTNSDGIEVYLNTYDDNPDEHYANAFAGNILMPKEDFVMVVRMLETVLKKYSNIGKKYSKEIITIIGLMGYYRTTYMSVVIRCFETGVLDHENTALVDYLLQKNDEEKLKSIFNHVAKDIGATSIMMPTLEDDYSLFREKAVKMAEEHIRGGLLTSEDFEIRLKEMDKAYQAIKEA